MDKRGCSESTDDYFHQQLFQLQEVDVWQIGPMNDDFQALQDELRYMFLEYITDADRILLNNISTRDLQHMADERQKSLAMAIVRQGTTEAQHCLAKARQHRIRDEHAMLQAVLARHNQFRHAAPKSMAELEAHTQAMEVQLAQKERRQADMLADRAAMRLNDPKEPYGEQQV